MHKKDLFIFFGEYRTFPVIPKQLFDLDKVDVILSTWKILQTHGKNFKLPQSEIDLCYKLIPHIKLVLSDDVYFGDKKLHNSAKMYYHWRNAINSVEDETKYDKVFLHRCDMISNWHIILNQDWEPNTLYVETANSSSVEIDKFWINDYYLGGDFNTVKRFVNLFKDNNDPISHIPLGNTIIENNFKWKKLNLKTLLIRDYHKDFISDCNFHQIKFLFQDRYSPYTKKYIEIHNEFQPNFKLDIDTFN